MNAFYEVDGDGFIASPLTRGPWDDRFQHGGPPAALLAGFLAALEDEDGAFEPVRVGLELLRPVPIGRMTLEGRVEGGRTAQRVHGVLRADGKETVRATVLRLRRAVQEVEVSESPAWPTLEDAAPYEFTFFRNEVGYHKAIELRIAHGEWGSTPVGFWARPRVPLVAGQETTALQRLLILADAQSGMGVPLDPHRYTFVNPDLTVYLERPPVGEWFGFDIRSTANRQGYGLAQSAIRDGDGLVARSAQSLVVRPRG